MTRDDGGDTKFVTDAELIRLLNLPVKIGRRAIRELEKQSPARPRFPSKDPLFGNRRYLPAIEKYLDLVYGVDRNGSDHVVMPPLERNQNAPKIPAKKT